MWWFIIIVILVAVLSVPSFLVANKLLKKTGWWKNQFLATAQFDLHGREVKYDVVNLGSNPSRFAFFYENIGKNQKKNIKFAGEKNKVRRKTDR